MALCTVELLSGIEKAKLQVVLHNVEFANKLEITPFQCCNCGELALYHYLATCKHVFCGRCHGQFHGKPCPAENCRNECINEISQNPKFEQDVYELKAICAFHRNGCQEVISLVNYLMHQKHCKFSTKKLLPKVWVPPQGYQFIKQVEDDTNILKSEIKEMKGRTREIDKKFDKKVDLLENKLSAFIEQMGFQFRTNNDQMNAKIAGIRNQLKDKTFNDQLLKEIIDEKSKQMAVDMSITISEQMFRKIDSITTDLKIYVQKPLENLNSRQEELELSINSKFNEKSKAILNQLMEFERVNESQIHKNVEFFKTMHEGLEKNIDSKFHEKSNEILKKVETSIESYTKFLNAMMDEKTNVLTTSFEGEACIAKQELKSMSDENIKKKQKSDILQDNKLTLQSGLIKEIYEQVEKITNCTTHFYWRIEDWNNVQMKGEDIFSNVFYTRDYCLKMRGKLMFKDSYIYPWVEFVYESSSSKSFPFVYYHRRTFVISIRKDRKETKKFALVQEPGLSWYDGKSWMTECEMLECSRCKFLAATCMDIQIIIEPLEIFTDFQSRNEFLIWNLENYAQKKREGREYGHSIWSETFYYEGGRFKVGLNFNATKIDLKLYSVHDELDVSLSNSSYHKITMILDQSGLQNNIVKRMPKTCVMWDGKPPVQLANIAYKEIETQRYLKDDSIIIKVMFEYVQPQGWEF